MARVTLTIADMHCSNCVMRLEAIEDDLPGIQRARASYHGGRMVVEYDESRLTIEQIVEAVARRGYHATPE